MLSLTPNENEKIILSDGKLKIVLYFTKKHKKDNSGIYKYHLGIEAPEKMKIWREPHQRRE